MPAKEIRLAETPYIYYGQRHRVVDGARRSRHCGRNRTGRKISIFKTMTSARVRPERLADGIRQFVCDAAALLAKKKKNFFFRKNRVTSSHSTLPDRNCFFSLQIGTKEQSERVIFAKLSLGCLYQSFRSSGWHHPARSWSHSKLSFLESSTRLFFTSFSLALYIYENLCFYFGFTIRGLLRHVSWNFYFRICSRSPTVDSVSHFWN